MKFPKPSLKFSRLTPIQKLAILEYVLERRLYDIAFKMRRAETYRVRTDHHDYVDFFDKKNAPVVVMIHRKEWEQIFPSH